VADDLLAQVSIGEIAGSFNARRLKMYRSCCSAMSDSVTTTIDLHWASLGDVCRSPRQQEGEVAEVRHGEEMVTDLLRAMLYSFAQRPHLGANDFTAS
jgi:hypothetical protein